MQYKGLGKAPEKLLIKGWLIPENRKYYRFKSNVFVLESLPMLLNMWIAIASERFALTPDSKESMVNALTLIVSLDQDLMNLPQPEVKCWLTKLRNNDQFYIDYYKRLLELVKIAIASGKYAQLNGSIQSTWEYKQWMEEAGYLLATPNLIDGWLHPLSEFETINGEQVMNFWAVASILAAAATERTTDGGDKQTCITRLIQLGVLRVETDFNARLTAAQYIDAEYLAIVNQAKEALDKSVNK